MTEKQASQRSSHTSGSQLGHKTGKPSKQTQWARKTTPDRPRLHDGESRDELAKIFSQHNGQRKRNHKDLEDDKDKNDDSTPSFLSLVKAVLKKPTVFL